MAQKIATPKFSDEISTVCQMFESVQKDYSWNCEKVIEMDRLTQDYLHLLELGEQKYDERAKTATALQKCRQQRRQHKDTVIILEPLVQYLDTDKGKQLMNLLREALGKTRRAEERLDGRIYVPRVLDMEGIK